MIQRTSRWSPDAEVTFEQAQHILRGVVAAYSHRLDGAASVRIEQLRDEQAGYARQLSELDPNDQHTVTLIIEEYPARLESLRHGDSPA